MGGRGSSGGGGGGGGMSKLSGSEKQVSWANQLRQNVIGGLRGALPEIKKSGTVKRSGVRCREADKSNGWES